LLDFLTELSISLLFNTLYSELLRVSFNSPQVYKRIHSPFLCQSRVILPLNASDGRDTAASRRYFVTCLGGKLVQLWLEDIVGSFTRCRRSACWVNKRLQHSLSHEAYAKLIQSRQHIICYNLKDVWWLLRAFSKAVEGFQYFVPSSSSCKT
jgi:hypothetical protein